MNWVKRVLAISLVAILTYYVVELVIAYQKYPEIKEAFLAPSKTELKVDDLSERQLKILIKVQDPNFWNHSGVEFSTPGSGWTTVTQSLAKWFYFNPFKQGIRKIKQTLLARFVIHYQFSKQEQLTIFINQVWFEPGVKGFGRAAQHYYQKAIGDLTEDEFITLMAMPVRPKYYNVRTNPENNQRRSNRIKRMLSGEYTPKGLFDIYYDKEKE